MIDRQWLAESAGFRNPKQMLKRLYDKGLSLAQISNYLGVSDTTIKLWMREYEIPRRPRGGKNNNGGYGRIIGILSAMKYNDLRHMTVTEIAQKIGADRNHVRTVVKKLGFDVKQRKKEDRT